MAMNPTLFQKTNTFTMQQTRSITTDAGDLTKHANYLIMCLVTPMCLRYTIQCENAFVSIYTNIFLIPHEKCKIGLNVLVDKSRGWPTQQV